MYLGISNQIEINKFSSCSNCKHKTCQQRYFQDDLLVPLYEHIESGANITSHINRFLTGLVFKECPSCKVKSFSSKNEIICFPELLVVCVGRSTVNKNKVVKFDSQMRLQGADENKFSAASYTLPSAITHSGKKQIAVIIAAIILTTTTIPTAIVAHLLTIVMFDALAAKSL